MLPSSSVGNAVDLRILYGSTKIIGCCMGHQTLAMCSLEQRLINYPLMVARWISSS